MNGKLYLIPVTLGSPDYNYVIPAGVLKIIGSLRVFIVEDIRSARRFLRLTDPSFPIDDCEFMILNKNTPAGDIDTMFSFIREGKDTGLMSEAGLPGVADPGSDLVSMAHKNGYRVVPLSGPSSIFLALMSSGLNGQNFAFNGYLPVDRPGRIREIKRLESLARKGQSQIFMETPYRNMKMLHDLADNLGDKTMLCVASSISHQDELIMTMLAGEWRKKGLPDINKKPTIFIIG